MSNDGEGPNWKAISEALRRPLDPEDVELRIQGDVRDMDNTARVVAYINARAVDDLLDDVVGVGNWSFDWTPLLVEKGEVKIAKGVITIYGVSKSDVGVASNTEPTKGCISDALKRTAARWGIGRYLYGIRLPRGKVEQYGKSWALTKDSQRELRAKLPRPAGTGAQSTPPRQQQPPQQQQQQRQSPVVPRTIEQQPGDPAAIVAPAVQADLKRQIMETYGYKTAEELQGFLNKHVRGPADARGVIDALALKDGRSNLNEAELTVVRETLSKAKQPQQRGA